VRQQAEKQGLDHIFRVPCIACNSQCRPVDEPGVLDENLFEIFWKLQGSDTLRGQAQSFSSVCKHMRRRFY
jgi:hypothetical protein